MFRKQSMKKEYTAKVLALLQALEIDPKSAEFREPVDYIGLGIIDYPTIIKKPMDMTTVKVHINLNLHRRRPSQILILA
jgi:hypothetical protein